MPRKLSRKGSGLSLSATAAGQPSIPADACGPDKIGVPVLRGPLKKMSRKGRWQTRSFQTTNAYLLYFGSNNEIRCCHDLRLVVSIDVLDRWGRFELRFSSPADLPMKLKARNLAEAERWVENLTRRRQYFEGDSESKTSIGGGSERKHRSSRIEAAATPRVILRYESTPDPETRANEYRERFESAFAESTVVTIEDKLKVLSLFLEELTDTAEICRHRPEIVLSQISSAHWLIKQKLHVLVWGEYPGSDHVAEAHEALKLMDVISSFETLLADISASPQVESYLVDHGSDHGSSQNAQFTAFLEEDQAPRMLDHLTRTYVSASGQDLMHMARDMAQYVLENPNKAIQTDPVTGIVSSSGPLDFVRMSSQYLEHAQQVSDYANLRGRVLLMIHEPACAFVHYLALRTAQVRHLLLTEHPGEELLFLCVVVNDCEFLVEKLTEITEEHLEDLGPGLLDKIQEAVDFTEEKCEATRKLALLQVERVIFDDMEELSRNLFGGDVVPLKDGATINVEPELITMILTLDDYFLDVNSRIGPQSFVKLLGFCANRLLGVYVRRWIDAHTEQVSKGYRVAMKGKRALTDISRKTACTRLQVGIEEILQFFQRFGETHCPAAFFGLERTLRTQVQMAQMVLDVAYRAPLSSLVSDVFGPISRAYASEPMALGHIFALFSTLSLTRDFQGAAERWQAAFPDAMDAQGRPATFPYSRRNVLDAAFKALQNQQHTKESLSGALTVETDAFTSRVRRLPSKAEMKLRNKGKKRQEVLVGDQADAALEIVQADSTRNVFMRVLDNCAKVHIQIQYDAKVATGEILLGNMNKLRAAGRLAGIFSGRKSVKPRAASVGSSNSSSSTSTSTSTSPNTSTSISTSIPSAPKLPSLLSRTKSWWTNNNKSAGISKKEPAACSSPSSILDQDRYTAVVNQAKTLLATGAITANEYTELVNTFDRHLGSSATSSPSASPSPSSSNPSSGGGGALAAYKREVLQKAAASRQGATVLLDPEAKAEAQRTWLAHALGSHFSAFYKLGKETQDALVGAMEMKIHRAEGGRALMVQGEEGDKMFVIGTGNFDVLVSGNTSSIAKPDAFGEISGELSVAVATLGPGSVCGEIGLLFSSPRNATISLQKEFSTATLYCISRDSFNTAMGKSSKADVLALLKKQFASDPKSRRHGGGGQQIASSEKKSSAEQEKQRRLPDENSRRNRIATPGNLAISDDSVEAPNFAMARSLQESDAALLALHRMAGSCALHRRGSFLNTTTGKRVLDPPTLWRWAIKKIIFQAAVKKTTAFLDRSQTGDLQELFAKAPTPVLVVGRDWDDWLGKEIAILTNKLKNNDIDQTTFDRRVALLEARWSENV